MNTQALDSIPEVPDITNPNASKPIDEVEMTEEAKDRVTMDTLENQLSAEEQAKVLNQYSEIASIQSRTNYLSKQLEENQTQVNIMKDSVLVADDTAFIDEKIRSWIFDNRVSYPNLYRRKEAFISHIKRSKENLNYFYTNPETNEVVDFNLKGVPNRNTNELNFRTDFLAFLYTSIDTSMEIDAEIARHNNELAQFNEEYQDILKTLSDNVLSYIDSVERNIAPDDPNYNQVMSDIRHIRAGYDMSIFKETVLKYKSIATHTKEDIMSDRRIKEIGARYYEKLNRNDVAVSLVQLINDDPKQSFEYLNLPKGTYREGYENLFIFSLVRFFSMESWDRGIKKLHASVFNVISRLNRNDMAPELRESVINSVIDYLNAFFN